MTEKSPTDLLADLRVEIDRIDAAMHELLIERGGVIERLIAVKARQGGGSAFRPDREAAMMRRLAERHRGVLPLDTVESIWRVIIATFTFVQASYRVHADTGRRADAVRDSARFHFGFTVPLLTHDGPDAVVGAVARAEGDLGLVPVAGDERDGPPWWLREHGPASPRVIARLPFVERLDHPAGLPVFVLARPGAASAVRDVVLYALPDHGDPASAPEEGSGAVVVDRATGGRLVSVPGSEAEAFLARLSARDPAVAVREVGSHAARFSL